MDGHANIVKCAPLKVAIFGSTGSVGRSALDVIRLNPERFEVVALVAGSNVEQLAQQISEFSPRFAGLSCEDSARKLKTICGNRQLSFLCGQDEIVSFASSSEYQLMLAAVVGFAGLQAVLAAAASSKIIALANKESLVAAGALVRKLCADNNSKLIPVDSEHSAIFQLICGTPEQRIESISLTASGGPFFSREKADFNKISVKEALNHPRWSMGRKISLDSATMFNKALELIEAHWLFDVEAHNIKVLVHPQSIVHSFVHYPDGSTLAQLSVPDMKGPIAFALNYPNGRLSRVMNPLSIEDLNNMQFYPLDNLKFPAVELARSCFKMGSAAGAVFNSANEAAGAAFLDGRLTFDKIPGLVSDILERFGSLDYANFEDLLQINSEVQDAATALIKRSIK